MIILIMDPDYNIILIMIILIMDPKFDATLGFQLIGHDNCHLPCMSSRGLAMAIE